MENDIVNFIGDPVLPRLKKPKGREKQLCFSKMLLTPYTQSSLFGKEKKVSVKNLTEECFKIIEAGKEIVEYNKTQYTVRACSLDQEYALIGLVNTKELKEIMAKVVDKNNGNDVKGSQEFAIQYYTWALIRLSDGAIVYIMNKNVLQVNEILTSLYLQFADCNLIINDVQNPTMDIIATVREIKSLTFALDGAALTETTKSFTDAISWAKEQEGFKIEVTIKKPKVSQLEKMLANGEVFYNLKKPKISCTDQNLQHKTIDLFTKHFSLSIGLKLEDTDTQNNDNLKNLLIGELNKSIPN